MIQVANVRFNCLFSFLVPALILEEGHGQIFRLGLGLGANY